jgi:hypothetical protein
MNRPQTAGTARRLVRPTNNRNSARRDEVNKFDSLGAVLTLRVEYTRRQELDSESQATARAFGEGQRDNPRIPSVSALPALARLGSLRDPPKGRVNLSCTISTGASHVCRLRSSACCEAKALLFLIARRHGCWQSPRARVSELRRTKARRLRR